MRGFEGVKTFLKILLVVVAALVAIKLLPVTLALGFVLGLAVVGLAIAGLSVVAALAVGAIVVAAVLSPVWIPVLLIVGLIALVKRFSRRSTVSV